MSLPLAVAEPFRCPVCRSSIEVDDDATRLQCGNCGFAAHADDGVLDLVREDRRGPERSFYDGYYERAALERPPPIEALAKTWTDRDAPWEMQLVWESLGDLRDETVVLLGNGESAAELFMLTRKPRLLIYSDLSPVGLRKLRAHVEPGLGSSLVFAAIDALDLPLKDESVDVVYGFAFAHHLPDIEAFVVEVARVLRPGGRCVFMDNAYSPVWQHLKLGWLRPLMRLSHRREPRSPEDIRDTLMGGFREDQLEALIRAAGGVPAFERVGLLYYVWKRASVALFPEVFRVLPRHDLVSRACMAADRFLCRFKRARRNMIRLVWGFTKPTAPGPQGSAAVQVHAQQL
jgi:SAM-dependent methyltransferase